MHKHDVPLPIDEVSAHPMWAPPGDDQTDLTPEQRALQTVIAKALTPFDGRPNSKEVIQFCKNVYEASLAPNHANTVMLLGTISATALVACQKLTKVPNRSAEPTVIRTQKANTISRMAMDFNAAIAREAFQ